MKSKIFRGLVAIAVLAVIMTAILFGAVLYRDNLQKLRVALNEEANYYAYGINNLPAEQALRLLQVGQADKTRITLIDGAGKVLFDNQVQASVMANHADRQEYQDAVLYGVGTSERFSDTLDKVTYYHAIRLSDGKVLRVARTVDSAWIALLASIPFIIGAVILSLLVAFVLARRLTQKLIAPLDEVNLEHPLENDTYDELAPFLTRIAQQQKQLSTGLDKLKRKQEELVAITNNMSEGMLLLNNKQHILFVNESACVIFGVDRASVTGKNIVVLERGVELQALLRKVDNGERGETSFEKNGRIFQLSGSSVGGKGSVLLIYDVTERKAAEKLRREFSANVSHELKTPLQSILGYAEIMKNGLVKEDDKQRFLERIYIEAGNMIELIQNIMKLSRLEETAQQSISEAIALRAIVDRAVQRLQSLIAAKSLSVEVSGEAKIVGLATAIDELLFNLLDNAVKYNIDNGKILVTLAETATDVEIMVKDTGCGIATEDKERVFERFYRADKSHSKEIGGNGLGLSIVKHAVLLHKGTIELSSEPGQGTVIKVLLKKNAFA